MITNKELLNTIISIDDDWKYIFQPISVKKQSQIIVNTDDDDDDDTDVYFEEY